MAASVKIADYDPNWPERFRYLAGRIAAAMAHLAITIEHVGSTAVPGLAAKPIIDLDVILLAEDLPRATAILRTLGYEHEGDRGIAGREAFRWPPHEERHHLYVCPPDSPALRQHLLFRDHLRTHPHAARAYADLKRDLAIRHAADREAYQRDKSDFIAAMLHEAVEFGRAAGPGRESSLTNAPGPWGDSRSR